MDCFADAMSKELRDLLRAKAVETLKDIASDKRAQFWMPRPIPRRGSADPALVRLARDQLHGQLGSAPMSSEIQARVDTLVASEAGRRRVENEGRLLALFWSIRALRTVAAAANQATWLDKCEVWVRRCWSLGDRPWPTNADEEWAVVQEVVHGVVRSGDGGRGSAEPGGRCGAVVAGGASAEGA